MPIQPIDLQTLFMRMNQVGKEQAVEREAAHLAQTAQGSDLVRRSEEQGRTVNETRDLEEGPGTVKEDEEKNKNQPGEEETERKASTEGSKEEDIFKDPDLGNNIDISG